MYSAHLYALHSYCTAILIHQLSCLVSLFMICHKLCHSHITLMLSPLWLSCDMAEISCTWGIEPVISAKVWNCITWSRLVSHNGGSLYIMIVTSYITVTPCDWALVTWLKIGCMYEKLNQWSLRRSGIILCDQDWWAITEAPYIMIVAIIRCLGQVTALRLDPLVDLIF